VSETTQVNFYFKKHIRIRQFNSLNYVVESKAGGERDRWNIMGFYTDGKSALKACRSRHGTMVAEEARYEALREFDALDISIQDAVLALPKLPIKK
jgi:hypothetical protein